MKNHIISSILIVFSLLSINQLQAQQSDEMGKNNYVVITKKIPQLQPILLTAEALKAEDGETFGEFEIIICGKEIGDITDPEKINKFIEKAEKTGVKIRACGFSINKFKVDKTKVPQEIETVENGILYNFQLQKKGYKSITL